MLSLVRRWRAAPPLQQRAMGPVVVLATVMGGLQIAFYVAREYAAPAGVAETLASAWALCIAGLAAAFLLGLFRRRLLLAGALGHLAGALRDSADAVQIRDALATALSDPTLELLYHDDARGGWSDARGRGVAWPPALADGRAVTVVGGEAGARAVAMIHDDALRDDEELLGAVNSMVLSAWGQERLLADLSVALADLESSRRRIAEAADIERARIEHDLHDGAQQRLIALRIKLSIADTLMDSDPVAGIAQIRALWTRGRRGTGRAAGPRRGRVPRDPHRPRARGGAALAGAPDAAGHARRRRRRDPPPDPDRERRVSSSASKRSRTR